MTFSKFTTSAALMGSLALSACGSSNPDAIREGAAPKSFQSGNDAVTYNTDTGIVTLNGSTAVQNGDQVNKSRGQASVITSQDGMFFTSIARDGITYAVSSVSTTGTPLSGQVYGTEGVSNAPASTFATYQGDYAGTIRGQSSGNVTDTITGRVTIGANFSDNTFQGNINDRISFATNGAQRGIGSTVGFNGRISSDLSFQGTSAGGGLDENGFLYSGSTGILKGVIGGDQGQSAAGIFEMNHTSGGGTVYTERGAFVASSD